MRELGRMLTFKGGDDAVGRFCCYACDISRRVRVDIGIVAPRVPSPPLRPGHRVAPSHDEVGSVRGTPARFASLRGRPKRPFVCPAAYFPRETIRRGAHSSLHHGGAAPVRAGVARGRRRPSPVDAPRASTVHVPTTILVRIGERGAVVVAQEPDPRRVVKVQLPERVLPDRHEGGHDRRDRRLRRHVGALGSH